MSDPKPQRVLLAGSRGNVGRAFLAYMKREHPEVEVVPFLPFPFSLQKLADALRDKSFDFFVNAASLGDDSASLADPYAYFDTNVTGVLNQLEMIRRHSPTTRFVNLGTIFEDDPARHSPYTQSKRMVRELVKSYRENHGLYAVTATLGFTEYYGRGEQYLARRITKGVARIAAAIKRGENFEPITLRDIDETFRWTWAEDVAAGIWALLNRDAAEDHELITSESHSVREFVEKAFAEAGLGKGEWYNPSGLLYDERFELRFLGHEVNLATGEFGPVKETETIRRVGQHVSGLDWNQTVVRATRGFGNSANSRSQQDGAFRVRTRLNWSPKHTFDDIVREMMRADLREVGL